MINLAVSPGVKFKQSNMPFVQMENISHFLRACQSPPLSLPPHDMFLTVDLYENKDPAQVLQCLGAFSRRANAVQPSRFPRSLGAKAKGAMSPQETGSSQDYGYTTNSYGRSRGTSNVSDSTNFRTSQHGRASPTKFDVKPPTPTGTPTTSSWSRKGDEGNTAPAWNIHQYGYMGGASQGNQGIAFGARRQITSAAPAVPSMADREKKRREEEERQRQQAEEAERQRRAEHEAEEARARQEEERRWAEETRRMREREQREAEEQERRLRDQQRRREQEEQQAREEQLMREEQERQAREERKRREDHDRRVREEREAEERYEQGRQRKRGNSDARLRGQFLSQYQAEQNHSSQSYGNGGSSESDRIRELERQLAEAKERESRYEAERKQSQSRNRSRSRSRPRPKTASKPAYDASANDERDYLRQQWQNQQEFQEQDKPALPTRPLPDPTPLRTKKSNPALPARPLPDPSNLPTDRSRTDRYLASNPAPVQRQPNSYTPRESAFSTTAEVDAENARRFASTQKTRAGGWASKSLLEREMERERERQREWEESQKETEQAAKNGVKGAGTAPGEGAWDVHQYGWLGGDSQNRGGHGLGVGGARRQIIGPRPPP